MFELPSLVETNAIDSPSGDQSNGPMPSSGLFVTRFCSVPSGRMV